MNKKGHAFPIALRESVAVIDRLCNIGFTGNSKAMQLKLFESMGLKEGISCRGWPWINLARLDLRPLSGYINQTTWRNANRRPKLLSLSSIRYHYGILQQTFGFLVLLALSDVFTEPVVPVEPQLESDVDYLCGVFSKEKDIWMSGNVIRLVTHHYRVMVHFLTPHPGHPKLHPVNATRPFPFSNVLIN